MDLQELIKKMSLRPGMFVGEPSFRAIYHFIGGYELSRIIENLATDTDMQFKNEFHQYVKDSLEYRYNVKLDDYGNYGDYIEQVEQREEKQIKLFFELANKFFKEIAINKKPNNL